MTIILSQPDAGGLAEVADVLRAWQHDGIPPQLHPGDLGWFWRNGAAETAAAVRTWSRDGRVLAVGLLDGPGLLRLALAPDARDDEELTRRLAADILAGAETDVDASMCPRVEKLLAEDGWRPGEPWTPLRRDLAEPVPDPGRRIEVIGPERAHVRAALQRASFDGSTFTDERWHAMAAGPPYAGARCLVAHDDRDEPVAAVTVWSIGPGRPGLLEPMGVHREHRGQGHGTAIVLAAAAALRELGASSATVCTPSSNAGAVATYRAAGFQPLPEIRDHCRPDA
ncbi:GNAT family N-acetyltransferase [Actinomadura sp. ATCC 31491]|uniref:GNAT family N-acetyltransferase n=1 Tax=Actinomadura luzonensis TaxID=2805427 RepID=A0ABT0G9S2_9ACTN|nr:GNAT family N-acetyltransferase [Actinomadura luzonensis]MCK2221234.1 GNAT family N-acetyltransferase [Actinomadura luzonensis]